MKKLPDAKRVVVKVGTSVLTSKAGLFSKAQVERVSGEVLEILREDREVVLVSSGAIACGMDVVGVKSRPDELPKLQACAAIGQGKLMRIYENFFSRRKFHTAQVLLTREGIQDRERYLNARNTLNALLQMRVLPIVNENDTVATEEIRFGDNDTLSALVSSMVEADLLVILSDVEGFYLKDRTRLPEVASLTEIDEKLRSHIYAAASEKTSGGMETKLEAARFAMQAGVTMIIANGRERGVLARIMKGDSVGTQFHASLKKRKLRKNWLAFMHVKGEIQVDEGARAALTRNGRSLLPSGIVKVSGSFQLGDGVRILNAAGQEIARGLVNYSDAELEKIMGKKTQEIRQILGYKYYDEVVHRDNLVITKEEAS